MLQTVKAFITTCKTEDYNTYFQDCVFDLQNKNIEDRTNSIHSIAWSLKGINGVDKLISEIEDQLKEMLHA